VGAVNKIFSLEELAEAVREWCEKHRIVPANGQAADQVTERNIRYYRTLGLLDAPVGSYVKSFTEKHLLQLLAVRIYQAQGLPLRKIRDELYGKSEEELRQFTRTAAKTGVKLAPAFAPPSAAENWQVVPLSEDFLLVSRRGQPLPASVVQKLRTMLEEALSPKSENVYN
jgi:DNA-binding transcriptional MerR regulator